MAQTSRRIGSNRPVCLWLALLPLLCAGAFANAQNGAQRAGGGPPPSYSGGAGRSSGFQARSFGPTADYNAMNARLARSFGYVSGFLPPIRHTGTGYSYAAADAGSERRSGTNAPP